MKYTMKQMAAMFDVTEHTLRYYTDLGLQLVSFENRSRKSVASNFHLFEYLR